MLTSVKVQTNYNSLCVLKNYYGDKLKIIIIIMNINLLTVGALSQSMHCLEEGCS